MPMPFSSPLTWERVFRQVESVNVVVALNPAAGPGDAPVVTVVAKTMDLWRAKETGEISWEAGPEVAFTNDEFLQIPGASALLGIMQTAIYQRSGT